LRDKRNFNQSCVTSLLRNIKYFSTELGCAGRLEYLGATKRILGLLDAYKNGNKKWKQKLDIRTKISLSALVILLLFTTQCFAQIRSKQSGDSFARGYSTLTRGKHGQWVRSKAQLNPDGTLIVGLGLETDSTLYGISGYSEAMLKDSKGNVLARYKSAECGIPGKKPGKARIADFGGRFNVPPNVASQVVAIDTSPHVTHDCVFKPIGINNVKIPIPIIKIDL